MFAMNLNVFNTIEISDRDNSGPYTIFIMIFERCIDIRGRLTNFKVTFFVLAAFASIGLCTTATDNLYRLYIHLFLTKSGAECMSHAY